MENHRLSRPKSASYTQRTVPAMGTRPPQSAVAAPVSSLTPGPALMEGTKTFSVDVHIAWPRFRRLRTLSGRIFAPRRRRQIRRIFSNAYVRGGLILMILVLLAGQIYPLVQNRLAEHTYDLRNAETLLPDKDPNLGKQLVYGAQAGTYSYNQDYSPAEQASIIGGGGPVIKAVAYADPTKGLKVTDPNYNLDFTITPKFPLLEAKQDANRLIYPLQDGTGWLVYTMEAGRVKEDIILKHANGDSMKLDYTMDLEAQGLAARVLADGSVGIYGTSQPITGNVSTSTDKDAKLLQAARNKAKKDKLFFSLPAPVVYENGSKLSKSVKTHYEVKGETITTITTGLKHASFPLTVDPAVTVTSTADLFRDTTPESNIDLNANTGTISRGAVTGGTLPAWTTNVNSLATSRFAQGVAVYDDYVYVAGGIPQGAAAVPTTSVEIAKISSGSSSIGAWSSTTSLPLGIAHFQLQAYNGYLYAIGGGTVSNTCDTVTNTIYYTRIQSNGQLSSTWNTNPTTIPTAVCSLGATTYNGKLYVAGGQTTKQFNSGITGVAYASFNPNGSVGAFTSSPVVLPGAATGGDLRSYNGYLYFLGGLAASSNTVYYAAIASDGSIYGSSSANWKATTSFVTARSNVGSSFTFAYEGFMYLSGGCNNFNGSFACASVLQDTQIAQINADGSLGAWSNDTAALLPTQTVGNSIVSWRGNVYSVAGCSISGAQVSCDSALATQQYSAIAAAGQVGPLNTTTAMPASLVGHGGAVLNGYMYVVGGCITNSCQGAANNVTGNVSYAKINADGTVGTWTTDTTNKLNTTTGLAYFGFTAHNGYLYATGGFAATGASTSINSSTIYYVKPSSTTGALPGAWSTSATLSAARYGNSAVAYHGFLYVIGGCSGNTATSNVACTGWSTVIDRFTLSSTTGAPSTINTTALPTGRAYMGSTIYNGYIYLTGGQTAVSTYTSSILYASVSSAGVLGSWTTAAATLAAAAGYTNAYANNGYLYVTGGYNGTAPLNTIQAGKITLSSGAVASLSTTTTTMSARWAAATVFSNGSLYILGGCTAGTAPAGCTASSTLNESVEQYYASNKNTSAWTTNSTTYTTNRVTPTVTAYNGYIYVVGGCASFSTTNFYWGCTNTSTSLLGTTFYAPLNPDGTIGTWSNGGDLSFSSKRAQGCLVGIGGSLYYLGGFYDSINNPGYPQAGNGGFYSSVGANGAPGTWNQLTRDIGDTSGAMTGGINRGASACAVFNNRIYLSGGVGAVATVGSPPPAPAVRSEVYHTPDLSTGGDIGLSRPWTAMTSFTTARENHVALAAGGYLYIMGGDDKTNALRDVQYIRLNPATGDEVGSWNYTTDLPYAVSTGGAYAANGYIYVIGGRTAVSTCVSTTVVASINSAGTLSEWSQSVNNLASGRIGFGSAFYNGYYYALGGYDCSAVVTSNVIQLGGMRSQAMKGSFSKYADLNGNGQPEQLVIYLTNAQNNGVDIEKWRLVYRSSREAANSWGTPTTITPLVTENAYTVSALDGSAVNQLVSRWFWLTFDINMEQSFTFTDDVQPTIYQYGLHYAPPPAKRLLHGRDFRDQNQQGLDLKLGI